MCPSPPSSGGCKYNQIIPRTLGEWSSRFCESTRVWPSPSVGNNGSRRPRGGGREGDDDVVNADWWMAARATIVVGGAWQRQAVVEGGVATDGSTWPGPLGTRRSSHADSLLRSPTFWSTPSVGRWGEKGLHFFTLNLYEKKLISRQRDCYYYYLVKSALHNRSEHVA